MNSTIAKVNIIIIEMANGEEGGKFADDKDEAREPIELTNR